MRLSFNLIKHGRMKVKLPKANPVAVDKFPFIAFRPNSLTDSRIRSLAKNTGMSISDVVLECIAAHLPVLEDHANGKI